MENSMQPVSARIKAEIAALHPGYFALVMATGIVSLAGHYLGVQFISQALLWMNIGFFAILWMLFLSRILLAPKAFFSDFADFYRAPGFFTVVAGACILGNQFAVILKSSAMALSLLYMGIGLWLFTIYPVFLLFVVRPEKPPLHRGINGSWLVATVATQAVANLSIFVSSGFPSHATALLFIAMTFFSAGVFLYILVITLIFYRWMFFPIQPAEMEPPYWINLGALAISTLAAALLAQNSYRAEFLRNLHWFFVASTILLWASATWWLPLHIVLGFWKHIYSGEKFKYSPKYWSMVFPLGMYTSCTYHLYRIIHLEFILTIARYFYLFAVIAWALTFLGMLNGLRKILFPGRWKSP